MLRTILWLKYKIKDNEVFEKAYKYVEMYYTPGTSDLNPTAQEVTIVQKFSSKHSKDEADDYDDSRIWMAAEGDMEDNA